MLLINYLSIFVLCLLLIGCEGDTEQQIKGYCIAHLKQNDTCTSEKIFGIFIITENLDSILSFNVPASVHGIEILEEGNDFQQYFSNSYAVLFNYREARKNELKCYSYPPMNTMYPSINFDGFSQAVVYNIRRCTDDE